MIFDLPRDLIEEILSRVSFKSKKAMQLTCKKWNSSITKIYQGKLESELKEGESRIIVLIEKSLYLMSVVVNENPSTKTLAKLTSLNEQVKISQVIHCEGLLLVILGETKVDTTKIVVWNQYLGQTRWIEPNYSHQREYGWLKDNYGLFTTYALGYVNNKNNKSCRNHKILRLCDFPCGKRYLLYDIYNFDSDLWTTLDVPPRWCIPKHQCGVSLKGNPYWCGENYEDEDDYLICFDFTSETFEAVVRMPFKRKLNANYVSLTSVREEKLAVLLPCNKVNSHKVEIWMTSKIEVEKVSWSKFATLDTEPDHRDVFSSYFIDEAKKVLMRFDEEIGTLKRHTLSIIGEAEYLRKLDLGECENRSYGRYFGPLTSSRIVCSYVPSLEKIKQHTRRVKRKNTKKLRKAFYT